MTAKDGSPKTPKVALLDIETVPADHAQRSHRQHVADLLGLSEDEGPPLRLKGCHLSSTATGSVMGSCPKVPSDLDAKVGDHVDTHTPPDKERIFGDVHLQ